MAVGVKLCESKASFEATLERPAKLELMKLKGKILSEKFGEVLATTPYVLVLKRRGMQVSVYKSGRLLIKADERLANLIAGEVYDFLEIG